MGLLNFFTSRFYKRLALLLYYYPLRALVGCVVILLMFVSQLKTITIDTSTEGFLADDSSEILQYNAFLTKYERDEVVLLTLQSSELFSLEFFSALNALHQQLENELPYIQEVDSLINARNVYGLEDELVIETLTEDFPKTPKQMEKIKAFAIGNSQNVNRYFDKDLTLTTIFVRLKGLYPTDGGQLLPLSSEFISAEIERIKTIVAQHEPAVGKIHLSGSPMITEHLKQNIKHDMRRFTMLTLVIVLVLLGLVFRRLKIVVLPLVVVIPSVLLTFSLMAITGQPIQSPVTILPAFLLALGVADSIHFLGAFLKAYERSPSQKRAMIKAMHKTAIPMLLTSLTTAAGMLSFSTAGIVPIANLGIFAAFGVVIAFVLTVVLLPITLRLINIKRPVTYTEAEGESKSVGWFERMIERLVPLITDYAKPIVVVFGLIMAFSFYSISLLQFSHNPLKWFPEDAPIRVSTQLMGDKMGGVIPVELIIDSGVSRGAISPEFLKALDAFVDELNADDSGAQAQIKIGKVIALTDIVKEVNQALHADDPTQYRIPDNGQQIAQELILVEMGNAEDLYQLTDRDYRVARVTVMSPWLNATAFPQLKNKIMEAYQQHLAAISTIEMTGIIAILMQTMNEVIHTTAVSYTLAFVLISLMMILLLRSVRYGLVAMIPNVFPVAVILAGMYWFGIPLDMFTLLVGTIAIGLAVDDTIHFMHSFRQHYDAGCNVPSAIQQTLTGAGRAMCVTTMVLAGGFFVFTQSNMGNLQNFGVLTGICIVLALVSDFILAPALMVLMHGSDSEAGKKNPMSKRTVQAKNSADTESKHQTELLIAPESTNTANLMSLIKANQRVAVGLLVVVAILILALTESRSNPCHNLSLTRCLSPNALYHRHISPPPVPTPTLVTQGKQGVLACMNCHGDKGQGDWDAGYPRLAGLNGLYIEKQLKDFSRNNLDVGVTMEPISRDYSKTPRVYKDLTVFSPGIRYEHVMSDIAKKLTDSEIEQLGVYYAQLPFKATPVAVDFQTLERGRELALRGKPEYMLPRCSGCHGPKGQGFGRHFPPLAGQPPSYIISQINRWQRGERDNDHLAMMKNVANLLTDGDKVNIAAYYSNMSYQKKGG